MSIFNDLATVFNEIQHDKSSFARNITKIVNCFEKESSREYTKALIKLLHINYFGATACESEYTSRCLNFLAKLIITLVIEQTEAEDDPAGNGKVYDFTENKLFLYVLRKSVEYYNINQANVRYNTVFFLEALLQNMGNNVEIENRAFEDIIKPLMDLLYDARVVIRCKAIETIKHLQDPFDNECVITKELLKLLGCPNPRVRATVLKCVVPNGQTVQKLKEHIRDIHPSVRHEAFERISMHNPHLLLQISERIDILRKGFALAKSDKKLRLILEKKLLVKWLNHFNCEYLTLLKSVKLDSEEQDFIIFLQLGSDIMEVFLRDKPIEELVEQLPINQESKLIPIKDLNLESVLYWSLLVKHLRKNDLLENLIEQTIPNLKQFVEYIQNILDHIQSKRLEDHEFCEFQFIICVLLDIASNYDFSDLIGKKLFYEIGMEAISTYKLDAKVRQKWIWLLEPHCGNTEEFVTEICNIIEQTLEPQGEPMLTENEIKERDYMMAKVKMDLLELEMLREKAIDNKDYKTASNINEEYQKKLQEVQSKNCVTTAVKTPKDDPECLCKCLDLLIGVLSLTTVVSLTPSLTKCYEEFVIPLLPSQLSEVHCRVFECLAFMCKKDRDLALKHAKFLCLPCAAYATSNYNRTAVKLSIYAIAVLVRTFGTEIIEDDNSPPESQNSNKRRLYNNDPLELMVTGGESSVKVKDLFAIILTMFDDEDENLVWAALDAVDIFLLSEKIAINEKVLSTLILKYFTPGWKYANHLGNILHNYSNLESSKDVIGKALELTLISIATAPTRNELRSIDLEGVIEFFVSLTDINIHTTLMKQLLQKIDKEPEYAFYYIKVLQNLNLPQNVESCKEVLEIIDSIDLTNSYMKVINKIKSKVEEMRRQLEGDKPNELSTVVEEVSSINGSNNNTEKIHENNGGHRVNEKDNEKMLDEMIIVYYDKKEKQNSSLNSSKNDPQTTPKSTKCVEKTIDDREPEPSVRSSNRAIKTPNKYKGFVVNNEKKINTGRNSDAKLIDHEKNANDDAKNNQRGLIRSSSRNKDIASKRKKSRAHDESIEASPIKNSDAKRKDRDEITSDDDIKDKTKSSRSSSINKDVNIVGSKRKISLRNDSSPAINSDKKLKNSAKDKEKTKNKTVKAKINIISDKIIKPKKQTRKVDTLKPTKNEINDNRRNGERDKKSDSSGSLRLKTSKKSVSSENVSANKLTSNKLTKDVRTRSKSSVSLELNNTNKVDKKVPMRTNNQDSPNRKSVETRSKQKPTQKPLSPKVVIIKMSSCAESSDSDANLPSKVKKITLKKLFKTEDKPKTKKSSPSLKVSPLRSRRLRTRSSKSLGSNKKSPKSKPAKDDRHKNTVQSTKRGNKANLKKAKTKSVSKTNAANKVPNKKSLDDISTNSDRNSNSTKTSVTNEIVKKSLRSKSKFTKSTPLSHSKLTASNIDHNGTIGNRTWATSTPLSAQNTIRPMNNVRCSKLADVIDSVYSPLSTEGFYSSKSKNSQNKRKKSETSDDELVKNNKRKKKKDEVNNVNSPSDSTKENSLNSIKKQVVRKRNSAVNTIVSSPKRMRKRKI